MRKKRIYLVLALVLLLLLTACSHPDTDAPLEEELQTPPAEEAAEKDAAAEPGETSKQSSFPCELEDGRLIVKSLFQSDIMNPDGSGETVENLASIELTNQSRQFLASAAITVTLADGTELYFEAEDIPAGYTVWAFETGDAVIEDQPALERIDCEAVFEDNPPMPEDRLRAEADGTAVTLYNLTDESMTGLQVSFHCLFDEDLYFGGKVCTYPIDEIPAGGSAAVDAVECFLGTAEAVRAEQKP